MSVTAGYRHLSLSTIYGLLYGLLTLLYLHVTVGDLPVLQSLSLYAIYGLPAPLRVAGVAVSAPTLRICQYCNSSALLPLQAMASLPAFLWATVFACYTGHSYGSASTVMLARQSTLFTGICCSLQFTGNSLYYCAYSHCQSCLPTLLTAA